MFIETINPATEKPLAKYSYMDEKEVFQIIEQSQQAFSAWSMESFEQRAEKMRKAAQLLLDNKETYSQLITREMGKPPKAALEEIEKCATVCLYFAEHAKTLLANRLVKTELSNSYVTHRPLGSILAIMPWNFPFWQVFRFAAPCLMAGNCALLKHSPNTTGSALAIEKIFKEAGFPDQVFRTLILDNALAAKVIQHPHVAAISVTASNNTGETVAALAGKALKKVVMELGGNDPYIVLEDANPTLAAEAIITSRMNNAGQSCIAAKRILAVEAIRPSLQKLILEKLKQWQLGLQIGPLARKDLRDKLHEQIQQSVQQGAKILTGGFIPDRTGFYYPPTVLVGVKKGMPAYEEELFGPVITFIDTQDTAEAIAIANDTKFGLSAAIFTDDIKKGEQIAVEQIQAGTVFVNNVVRSDPRLPFGGIKASGYGRELSSEGILEFVNIKTIGIQNNQPASSDHAELTG